MSYKVIVAMLTYNLEKYVAEAIESVLSQKTNFDFKILISDDCSTDSTKNILSRYKNKYPDKIELILAANNAGCSANALRLYEKLDSEYFAILDGDDVWLNPERLQKQVDFLDEHRECSMCSGQTYYLIGDEIKGHIIPDEWLGKYYTYEDFFKHPLLLHVSGLLYRNVIFSNGVPYPFYETLNTFEDCAVRGEDFRRVIHLENGPAYIMSEVVSGYRIHNKGLWSRMSNTRKMIETAIFSDYVARYYRYLPPYTYKMVQEKSAQDYRRLIEYLINNKILYPSCNMNSKELKLLIGYLANQGKNINIESIMDRI